MFMGEGEAEALGGLKKDRELPPPIVTEGELRGMCAGNPVLEELLEDMLALSVRYAVSVAQFEQIVAQDLSETETKARVDEARGRTHDALIASVNVLSRNLGKNGKDNSWVGKFAGNRVAYGKFAILLALGGLPTETPTFDIPKE
jgi:hypothetical protein